MPIKDPEKRNAYRRMWYSKHKESEKRHVLKRKIAIRKWFGEYKSKLCCSKCSENHPATLDFHHKSGKDKKMGVTLMAYHGYAVECILDEISKCLVLCANCHRKIHFSKL